MLLEELPSSENRAKEDEIFQALLTFLSDPQAPQDLTLKWFVARVLLCPLAHVLVDDLSSLQLGAVLRVARGGRQKGPGRENLQVLHARALWATHHVVMLQRIIEL